MSRLDPNLKRLMAWARHATPPAPRQDGAPLGFATRVAASWKPSKRGSILSEIKQIARIPGWLSVGVIVCGLLILAGYSQVSQPAAGIPSAFSFLARNLTP